MSDELARVKRIGKAPGSDRVGVPVLQLLRKAEERLAVLHELLGHFDDAELLADTHLRAQNAELLDALKACITLAKHAAFDWPVDARRRLIEINSTVDTAIAKTEGAP